MNLLGMTIARVKGALVIGRTKSMVSALTAGDVWGRVREPFTGAWQRNMELDNRACVLAFSAVYSCVSIVSQDVGKLRCKLTEKTKDGIWVEITRSSPFIAVLEAEPVRDPYSVLLAMGHLADALRQHVRSERARRAAS